MSPRTTEVSVGMSRDRWHRYRWMGGTPLPGTTGIIRLQESLQGSDSLVNWAAKTAVDRYAEVVGTSLDPKAEALAAITTARDTGTEVHEALDLFLGGTPIPPTPTTLPYYYGIAEFLYRVKPEIIAREQMVANLTYGFGGTFDLAAVIDGKVSLVDFKTGKGKPSFGLQLAAYAAAEFIGKPDDPEQYPVPEFEAYYVLLLRPGELAELVPVRVGARETDHFLYLTEVYHRLKAWDKEPPVLEAVREEAA